MKILNNHIGYETTGHKHAVILGSAGDNLLSYRVLDSETDREVYVGTPKEVGPVLRWKDWHFWTIDFDAVQTEGHYIIECAGTQGTVRSFPFAVRTNLLELETISNILFYFKAQRCSGVLDQADHHLTFDGDVSGRTVDAHGGWYDATGDLGKHLSHLCFSTYFNPQQIPMVVWSLFKSHAALQTKHNEDYKQYLKRMLDEGLYGADYLVRLKSPTGSFYITVSGHGPEKAPEDRRLARVMRGFEPGAMERTTTSQETNVHPETEYQTSYRSGAGVAIAALAIASTHKISGEFTSADYLRAAEDGFDFLEAHNLEMTNGHRENIVDDYCALLAATELYTATKKESYRVAADKRAHSLINRLTQGSNAQYYWRADDGDRPFFHAADGGLPVVSLLNYLDIADADMKQKALNAVKQSLLSDLARTSEVSNPFGYSRQLVQDKSGARRTLFFFPHDTEVSPWWQGENARLASMVSAVRLAAKYLGEDREFSDRLLSFGWNQLNWILGLNPYDMCMLHGSGRNNPPYLSYNGSWQFTNCPGGICNGITSDIHDEEDIDFQGAWSKLDDNWRWGEQWLPHAAWFLLAVSVA